MRTTTKYAGAAGGEMGAATSPSRGAVAAELLAGERRSGAARRLPVDDTDGTGDGGRRGSCVGRSAPACGL